MKRNNKRIKRLTKLFLFLLVLLPVSIILSKAALSSAAMKVETLEREVVKKKNANESLIMKTNELKSLANIDAIAEIEGLSYNSGNIKVISNSN